MMIRVVAVIVLCLLLAACERTFQPDLSFYYWKTTFQLTPEEKFALRENEVTKVYVRYLDVVVKNGEVIPLSPVIFKEPSEGIIVTPVVYIRNEVMLQPDLDVVDLVEKIMKYIDQINSANDITTNEIQIDCDWTEKSKESYFAFLQQLKAMHAKTLSVTIRLHQIKYQEQTGVPPADKGVLMYYNMGRIAADASNSIYERSTAQKYLSRLKEYPLALDVALPAFSWGIHIRGSKVIGLLNKIDVTTFENDVNFERTSLPFIEVKNNTFKIGYYFQKGDRIKLETTEAHDLEGMVEDLREKLKTKPHEIIIYDLDNFNLKRYDHEKKFFKTLCADF
jgi:hypothetical protein